MYRMFILGKLLVWCHIPPRHQKCPSVGRYVAARVLLLGDGIFMLLQKFGCSNV